MMGHAAPQQFMFAPDVVSPQNTRSAPAFQLQTGDESEVSSAEVENELMVQLEASGFFGQLAGYVMDEMEGGAALEPSQLKSANPVQRTHGGGKGKAKKTLGDSSSKYCTTNPVHARIGKRAIRGIRLMQDNGVKRSTKKNYFHITFAGSKRRVTFHMLSAGLGGAHPKHHDSSASHTEQIIRGLLENASFQQRILDRLGEKSIANVETLTAYSSNECCNKNNSMEHGCRSIPTEDLSLQDAEDMELAFLDDYATGSDNTTRSLAGQDNHFRKELGVKKKAAMSTIRDDESDDEFVDTEDLRGEDLPSTKNI